MVRARIVILALLACLTGILLGLALSGSPRVKPSPSGTANDRVEIVFLDVGGGDCAVILTPEPDRKVVVIDGGRAEEGLRRLSPLLASRGVTTVDLTILSHPDPDHLGGLDLMTREYVVREIWDPGFPAKGKLYPAFRERMRSELGDTFRSPLSAQYCSTCFSITLMLPSQKSREVMSMP